MSFYVNIAAVHLGGLDLQLDPVLHGLVVPWDI